MNATETKTLTAYIFVWSEIGDCPVTGRKGSYCDELVRTDIQVRNIDDAIQHAKTLLIITPHAHYAHDDVPAHWNQNMRAGYVSR